jgi:hypothetical protein
MVAPLAGFAEILGWVNAGESLEISYEVRLIEVPAGDC